MTGCGLSFCGGGWGEFHLGSGFWSPVLTSPRLGGGEGGPESVWSLEVLCFSSAGLWVLQSFW